MRQPVSSRLSPQSGIALGPILFVLASLGLIAAALSAGSGGFSSAGVTDRIAADIPTQANLIRAKVNECNLMYGSNANYDGYPSSGGISVLVSAVTCTGDPSGLQNLWSGNRTANLPPPTNGFGAWYYINTNSSGLGGSATGGRCIWTEPTANNGGVSAGLTRAAKKFTTVATNDGNAEVNYNPASTNQRFVVWISAPPAVGQQTHDCDANQ